MNRDRLIQCASTGNIMHALLVTGHDGDAALSLAEALCAAFLFGNEDTSRLAECPDFFQLEPPYKVEMIRAINDALATEAFSHEAESSTSRWDSRGHRAILLKQADKMNDSCQNSLLKTLEEPPQNVLFLLTGTEAGILPTIRSRCSTLRLGAGSLEEVARQLRNEAIAPGLATEAARQADGYLSQARCYAREEYILFREGVMQCLSNTLFGGNPFPKATELLKMPVFDTVGDGKLKQEAANCPRLLELIQMILRDALIVKLSGDAPIITLQCDFARKISSQIAIRFTFAEIQGMINTLSDGLHRLALNANPVQTADVVLSSLMEKEN